MEQKQLDQLQSVISQLQGIYSEEEKEFIRSSFKGKVDLLVLLRNFFLQGEVGDEIKEFARPEWLTILRRIYFPEIDLTRPLGQVRDLWSYMATYQRSPEEAGIEIGARQILIDYMSQRFNALETGEAGKKDIQLKDLVPSRKKSSYENLVDLTARSLIMTGVEGSTTQLLMLANTTKETPAERKKREDIRSGM